MQDYLKKANRQCNRARQYAETPDLSPEDMYDIFAEADHDENLKETLEKHLNVLKIEDPAIGKALYVAKDLTVRINRKKLFNSAYTAYQSQFYYYPERLVDELSRRLNIPVYISYYTPEKHKLEAVENDRDSILQTLNSLYKNPVTKSILCDVLHNGKKIPADIDIEYRKMLARIQQSKLYKKEYLPLQKASPSVTFDYIVKVLNTFKSQSKVNKHISRIICMQNNQDILRKGTTSVKADKKMKQFNEQKVLISIITEKRKAEGKKYYTLNDKLKESLLEEFNKRISALNKGYEPKSMDNFMTLLYSVYIVKNRDIASRREELGEPVLCIEDVPFK